MLELREKFVPVIENMSKPNWKYDFPLLDNLKNIIIEKKQAYHKWIAHCFRIDADLFRLAYVGLRNKCKQMSWRKK